MKYLFWTLFVVLLLLIIGFNTLFIFFQHSPSKQKPAIFAGYASGSMIDYHFEIYEDSSYWLSCLNNSAIKKWTKSKDSLFLWQTDTLCATICKDSLSSINCKEFRCLKIMRFKAFSPDKVVDYPKTRSPSPRL